MCTHNNVFAYTYAHVTRTYMKKTNHLSQTGQNQTTGIVVGVVVSILFVIGIIFIIVAAIIFRQRCVRKWNKKPQNGFGMRKLYSVNVPKRSECE